MSKQNFAAALLAFSIMLVFSVVESVTQQSQNQLAYARSTDNLSGFAWSSMPTDSDQGRCSDPTNCVNPSTGDAQVGLGAGWIAFNSSDLVRLCGTAAGFGRYAFNGAIGCPPVISPPTFNSYFRDTWGVRVYADGRVSGYAWANPNDYYFTTRNVGGVPTPLWNTNNNIGWIAFSISSALTGCPSLSPAGDCLARFDRQTGQVTGWARAVRGASATSTTGNWDGWISLSTANFDTNENGRIDAGECPETSCPAVGTTMPVSGVFVEQCNWQGWAWGGDNLGWISFSSLNNPGAPREYGVNGNDPVSCAVEPKLTITPTFVTLVIGQKDTEQLHAWFDPDGDEGPEVAYEVTASTTWASADENVISLDPFIRGLIRAVDRGEGVELTATYNYRATATARATILANVLPKSKIIEIPPQ